jgi:hypothetical protein
VFVSSHRKLECCSGRHPYPPTAFCASFRYLLDGEKLYGK